MGYTHYFNTSKSFTHQEWEDVKNAVEKIVDAAQNQGIELQSDDEENPVIVTDERINLNSRTNPHETFLVTRVASRRDFCKTNRKSYDAVVCAILLYLAKNYPDNFTFSSNGNRRDWKEAIDFTNETFKDIYNDFAPE